MTNEEAQSLKAGLEYLSAAMRNEQQSAFWGGVDAIEAEMVAAATSRALERAAMARERLFGELAAQLPQPRVQPPAALQSDPVAHLNGGTYGHHYADPFGDDLPSFIGREAE